ncbi:hypothetical protein EMIHUDRAFT_464731 [Emiliania huxleyi CCMP1516]|uniref:ABC transporter domain-containing protein n=2 Tax=Emiliania huxleyi TaxID=2903 RepID=A0A0D3IPF2_EMIH1|nr:hypothetical protein EMIHUDRAFT_464731 [Emiliania huxleyi CCMP1516]EOD13137.1 hypothetical protein EMIHUDRAFT_464731 [Emiliania huxleyi CCMP1516]|eukprot:XP_005765566.1 hypothetical protein EMIHUDRAFT_464731 [Emiliania huxleyi CCMP1516]
MLIGVALLASASLWSRSPPSAPSLAGLAEEFTSPSPAGLAEEKTAPGVYFEGLTFSTGGEKGKTILHGCSGEAAPGRMLAIMGPSGSGKTTLLNALAGQLKAGPKATLTGRLTVGGDLCGGAGEVSGLRVAYVRQEDVFYTQMTAPSSLPRASAPLHANRLMHPSPAAARLDLGRAADTIVGDGKRRGISGGGGTLSGRGISGGERKRLAIGCELLSDPRLLFLDEPTSGLDAFAAQQVVTSLRRLASEGTTVLLSIHQPRGSIFALFDDLLLLSRGTVMYCGAAASAASHFAQLGHKCPAGISAAEHVVDIISTGYEPAAAADRLGSFERAAAAAARTAARRRAGGGGGALAVGARHAGRAVGRAGRVAGRAAASGATQFGLLLRRAWREVARSRGALAIKVVQQLMIAVIYGGAAWASTRRVYTRSALGLFIGAVAPTTDTALALFPPFLVLMIVFNGFNIAEESTPRALRWIPKVSFIRWCSEGLAVNEFSGLRFSCKGARGPCCETGEQALERVSFGGSTVRGAAVAQAKLVGGLYVATLLVLRRSSPKFLRVEPCQA